MKSIIAVVGPTGSGKTKLGVELAKKYNGIILSADSRQVYSGLNAATNKEGQPVVWQGLTGREIDGIPQLLVDIVPAGESFNLSQWLVAARGALEKIETAGFRPIVVGGTGLYVTALLEGYQLKDGGKQTAESNVVTHRSVQLMPKVERNILQEIATTRVEKSFDNVIQEIDCLKSEGVESEWFAKIGLDYRFANQFLEKQISREEAIRCTQVANRAYIRRQLTWWRHHGEIIETKKVSDAEKIVELFLEK